jgi:hypothetical protein
VAVLYEDEAWADAVHGGSGEPLLWRREAGDAAPRPAAARMLP